jgi:hypothetical protein
VAAAAAAAVVHRIMAVVAVVVVVDNKIKTIQVWYVFKEKLEKFFN